MSPQPDEQRCLDDGAYLLGALPPEERAAFEEHLRSCLRCQASVAQLAGLPGLLRTVPPDLVEALEQGDDTHDPPPETLLPGVLRTLERERRSARRRVLAWVGAAAAAAVVVAGVLVGVRGDEGEDALSPSTDVVALEQVQDIPLEVTARLTPVAWGTRIELLCSYTGGATGAYRPPPEYSLVVRSADGDVEQVASWRAVPGRQVTIEAATALRPGSIAGLEVRTPGGDAVLVGGA